MFDDKFADNFLCIVSVLKSFTKPSQLWRPASKADHRRAGDSRATMPVADFCAWQIRMGWTISEAARQPGISRTAVMHFRLCGAPRHIGLAAAALVKGLRSLKRRHMGVAL